MRRHAEAVQVAASAATDYLAALDGLPVRHPDAEEAAALFGGHLPDEGDGALAALRELAGPGMRAAIQSSGPRMFHFVTGGVTPAALGADWLASLLDQNALGWTSSPLAARLEAVAVDWLKELFRLPADWEGVLTSGATMANVSGLAAARQWWAERHGVDLDARGFGGAAARYRCSPTATSTSARARPWACWASAATRSARSAAMTPAGWTSTRWRAPCATWAETRRSSSPTPAR